MPKPKHVVNAQNREAEREATGIRNEDKESYAQTPGAQRPANQAPGAKIPGSDTEPKDPIPTPEAGPEARAEDES